MKHCKYCQAELAENGAFCPVCGKNNAEDAAAEETVQTEEAVITEAPAAEETAPVETVEETTQTEAPAQKPKISANRIALAVVAIVVLAAMLIALLAGGLGGKTEESTAETEVVATVPADGNPDDETCKGTYTASNEEVIANADTVVATMGDNVLTNAELQVYYWLEVQSFLSSYGYYISAFGLNTTQDLDTQICIMTENNATWQQFFLMCALQSWQNYQVMYAEAEENAFVLSDEDQEYLDNLQQSLEEQAVSYGFESVAAMLEFNVGAGADMEDYIRFNNVYYKGYQYYCHLYDGIELTEEAVEAYYLENQASYEESGITQDDKYVDVRHILIMPEGGTTDESGNTTYSDEEWAACEAAAQAILDEWLAGEATEDSFAELANQYTDDGNDADYDGEPDGGLYTDVYEGQMVTNFNDWCFDEARQVGDYGLVQTNYGYHVMYFVGSEPVWKTYAENDLLTETLNTMMDEIIAKYPMTVDYSAISLGYVDITQW